jgi:hypothetical protein
VLLDELPHVLGSFAGESGGGDGGARFAAEAADAGADLVQGGWCDGEGVAAEADEEGCDEGVGGGVAADGDVAVVAVCCGDDLGDGAEYGGWAARAGVAAGSRRSRPRIWLVRSLLPMERKAASRARSSAAATASGSSTMMPRGGASTPSSAAAAWSRRRQARSSSIPATMGIMMRRSVSLPEVSSVRN